MPFLPPNQQRQSTEGKINRINSARINRISRKTKWRKSWPLKHQCVQHYMHQQHWLVLPALLSKLCNSVKQLEKAISVIGGFLSSPSLQFVSQLYYYYFQFLHERPSFPGTLGFSKTISGITWSGTLHARHSSNQKHQRTKEPSWGKRCHMLYMSSLTPVPNCNHTHTTTQTAVKQRLIR